MHKLLAPALLIILCLAAPLLAQPVLPTASTKSVVVDTNGVLKSPANFFATNATSIVAALDAAGYSGGGGSSGPSTNTVQGWISATNLSTLAYVDLNNVNLTNAMNAGLLNATNHANLKFGTLGTNVTNHIAGQVGNLGTNLTNIANANLAALNAVSNGFLSVSNAHRSLSNAFINVQIDFLNLSNNYVGSSNLFASLNSNFGTVSNNFVAVSNAHRALSNVVTGIYPVDFGSGTTAITNSGRVSVTVSGGGGGGVSGIATNGGSGTNNPLTSPLLVHSASFYDDSGNLFYDLDWSGGTGDLELYEKTSDTRILFFDNLNVWWEFGYPVYAYDLISSNSVTRKGVDLKPINFTGAGVSAVTNADDVTVTISGEGGGGSVSTTNMVGKDWTNFGTLNQTGQVYATDGSLAAPSYSFGGETNLGWYKSGSAKLSLAIANSQRAEFSSVAGGASLTLSSSGAGIGYFLGAGASSPDVGWTRQAPATAAWRNGTNPQTNQVYNYAYGTGQGTNASWLELGFDRGWGAFFLRANTNATGTTPGTNYPICIAVGTNGANGIKINTDGTFNANATTITYTNTATNASSPALVITNSSPAVSNGQQLAVIELGGHGWKTTATAGSQDVRWRLKGVPVQGSANPSGSFIVESDINGGNPTTNLTLTSAGALTVGSSLTTINGIIIGNSSTLTFNGRTRLQCAGQDSVLYVGNAAMTDFSSLLFGGSSPTNMQFQFLSGAQPRVNFRDGTTNAHIDVGVGNLYAMTNVYANSITASNGISVTSSGTNILGQTIVTNNLKVTTGGITLGASGGTITNWLTATATLDFPDTAVQTSSELTISVTGAAVGDVVQVGIPYTNVGSLADSCFTAFVSDVDTVMVRFNNYSLVSAQDPTSGTFKVVVIKF